MIDGLCLSPGGCLYQRGVGLKPEKPRRSGCSEGSVTIDEMGARDRVGGYWGMIDRDLSVLHGNRKRAGKAQTRLT